MFLCTPFVVFFYFISCNSYDCSITTSAELLYNGTLTPWAFLRYSSLNYFTYHTYMSPPDLSFLHLSSVPMPTWHTVQIYALWHALQICLYLYCPGPRANGQETPAGKRKTNKIIMIMYLVFLTRVGHTLRYNINGMNAFIVTHILAFLGVYFGFFKATIIYDNWGELLILSNILGFSLAVFAYVKVYIFLLFLFYFFLSIE